MHCPEERRRAFELVNGVSRARSGMAVAKDATGALLGQAAAVAATRPHAAIGEHTCHAFPQQLLWRQVRLTSLLLRGVMAALVVQQTKYAYTINGAVWRQRYAHEVTDGGQQVPLVHWLVDDERLFQDSGPLDQSGIRIPPS